METGENEEVLFMKEAFGGEFSWGDNEREGEEGRAALCHMYTQRLT